MCFGFCRVMAKNRAAAPTRGGRPPVPRRGRSAGSRAAMTDTDDAVPARGGSGRG